MKKIYKIAVFGSAKEDLNSTIYKIAQEVGGEIAKTGNVLITGAAKGVSRHAAKGAKINNGSVIGISPTSNHKEGTKYNVSFENIDFIIHTGMGYKGRNVVSVRTCDGMIIINGNFGTLSEASIGEGEAKPIVVMKGTGGSADIMESIFKKLNPNYKYFAVAKEPKDAIEKLIEMMR